MMNCFENEGSLRSSRFPAIKEPSQTMISGWELGTDSLDFDPSEGRTRVRLERILADYPPAVIGAEWKAIEDGLVRLTLRLHLPRVHTRELLDDLVDIPEVRKVHEEYAGPVSE